MAAMHCNASGHLCAQHAVHLWMRWAWGNFAPSGSQFAPSGSQFGPLTRMLPLILAPAAGYVWEFSMYDTPQELELREGQVGVEYLVVNIFLQGAPPRSCCLARLNPHGASRHKK